jgi:hypothetical protein
MTEKELSISVRLSCQRALLGAITPNVRLVTIGWDGLKLFKLKAYFASEPGEDEIEDFNVVSTEVISDIPFENDQVECVYSNEPKSKLDLYHWIVYSRKE